jgi:NAD-dependent DNA ligase
LTGTFNHGSRSDVQAFIEKNGGIVLKGVTRKCDYVVVGSLGSESYSMGNYGTKVKEAMELQAKGIPIQIAAEDELYED